MKLSTFLSIKKAYEEAREEFISIMSWQSLCDADLTVEAVLKYRNEHPKKSLWECKEIIDSFKKSME